LLRKNRHYLNITFNWKGGAVWVRVTEELKKAKYVGVPMAKHVPRRNRKRKRNNRSLSDLLFFARSNAPEFEVGVYTPQGGTKKSALQGCLCPARVLFVKYALGGKENFSVTTLVAE